MGFLWTPLSYFVITTSIRLVREPNSISDGRAIIYVALLTGLYYVLNKSKGVNLGFIEEPRFTISKTLGLVLFLALYFLLPLYY